MNTYKLQKYIIEKRKESYEIKEFYCKKVNTNTLKFGVYYVFFINLYNKNNEDKLIIEKEIFPFLKIFNFRVKVFTVDGENYTLYFQEEIKH